MWPSHQRAKNHNRRKMNSKLTFRLKRPSFNTYACMLISLLEQRSGLSLRAGAENFPLPCILKYIPRYFDINQHVDFYSNSNPRLFFCKSPPTSKIVTALRGARNVTAILKKDLSVFQSKYCQIETLPAFIMYDQYWIHFWLQCMINVMPVPASELNLKFLLVIKEW